MTLGLVVLWSFDLGLSQIQQTVFVCLALALPMIGVECLVFRVHESIVNPSAARRLDLHRVCVKLVGLYAAFSAIALGYWLFPEYASGFYEPYFRVLGGIWPGLVALAVPYFLWLDRRTPEPHDGCWHAGMAVLGRWESVNRHLLGQFARSWLIKAFFLPLMFVLLSRSITFILSGLETGALFDEERRHGFLFELTFTVDLAFACVGYTLTIRALDTHIRSAEPTLLGWLVTLACYQPLWGLVSGHYLPYDSDGTGWRDSLPDVDVIVWFWSAAILVLSAVYAWASVAFGLRLSNLTHRGIITNGPYRFTKHPAYLAKNVSWWLIAVPFITHGPWHEALQYCLLLLLVNVLYYLRACTEERHLAQDPVYIQYALWIEENGLLRHLGWWFPRLFAFRWRRPEAARAALGWT